MGTIRVIVTLSEYFSTALTEVDMLVEFWKRESSKAKKDDKPQYGKSGGAKGSTMMAMISHKRRMTRGMVRRMARRKPNASTVASFVMRTIGCRTAQRIRFSTPCLARPVRSNRRHHQPTLPTWIVSNSSMH